MPRSDGPFAVGTRGWLKPSGAPRTRIEIVAVDAPASFTVLARLPLCRMRFEHVLTPIDAGTRVRHRVGFSGGGGGGGAARGGVRAG